MSDEIIHDYGMDDNAEMLEVNLNVRDLQEEDQKGEIAIHDDSEQLDQIVEVTDESLPTVILRHIIRRLGHFRRLTHKDLTKGKWDNI